MSGGYAMHAPTMYLVGWPDALIIKAGITTQQRWRKFCLRGADLHALYVVTDHLSVEHVELESAIGGHLHAVARRAFDDRTQAVPFVGHGGCGWMECYQTDGAATYHATLRTATQIAERFLCDRNATAMRDADAFGRCNGRTDERNEEIASGSNQSTGRNVRARVGDSMAGGWS